MHQSKDKIEQFLRGYLPKEDLTGLVDRFRPSKVEKGDLLIKPGSSRKFLAYIESGCFRVFYYDNNANEVTTWFSIEDMVITDLLSFYTNSPASFYIEALEDSHIHIISNKTLENLYESNPSYGEFGRRFAEEACSIVMKRMLELQTKTAEDRYKELLKTPGFLQRIPLKYLASYLGVTDSSLSRIRRNIR